MKNVKYENVVAELTNMVNEDILEFGLDVVLKSYDFTQEEIDELFLKPISNTVSACVSKELVYMM